MNSPRLPKKQKGNMLISFGVYLLLAIIAGVLAIPKVKEYMANTKIEAQGTTLNQFIARVQTLTQDGGASPYTNMTQTNFANALRRTGGGLTVSDDGTVLHGLGGGTDGTIVLTNSGSAFNLTYSNVGDAACPTLANIFKNSVQDITINGTSVQVTGTDNTITTAFDTNSAEASCTSGDTNKFMFTVRQ